MMRPNLACVAALAALCLSGRCASAQQAPSADQQINDFSLAGYGEQGKKTWEVEGKSADIFNDTVKLDDVVGNLYGDAENVRLSADKGDYDKATNVIRLMENVVITTTSGARLTTDSLQWDRAAGIVSTQDPVHIARDTMLAVATGAHGEPSLKRMALEKDVRILVLPVAPGEKGIAEKIVITCDGPFDIDYSRNTAVLRNNVIVERENATIYSDLMDVFFASSRPPGTRGKSSSGVPDSLGGKSITKIVARNNVKVVRGENVSYSEEAEYNAADGRIILRGRPKIVVNPSRGFERGGIGETTIDAASSGN